MQYALLIYADASMAKVLQMSPEEQEAITDEYMEIRSAPGVFAGAHLEGAEATTTLLMKDGRTLTTDGPFIETKETMGGFYMVEADDLDQALALAARIPAVRLGGAVEVRPVVQR